MSALKNTYFRWLNFFRKLNFFLSEKLSEIFDASLFVLKINATSLSGIKNLDNTIVFTGLQLNHRVIKHLKYLKKLAPFQLVVIHHTSDKAEDLSASFYDFKISFRNKFHLKRILHCSEKLKLIYAFASKPSYAKVAIEVAKCPTIFDPYDCLIVYYGKNPKQEWMQKEIIDEEFCFKNATGILARNLEINKSFELYNLKKTKNILFSDYCDNDYFVSKNKNSTAESIVYSGGIYGKHMLKSSHGIENFFDFIYSMNDQGIDVNIYPSPHTMPEVYYDYAEESKKLKHLHLHKTVLQKDLATEISGYHFGVSPHFKEESSVVSKDKLERGTSLKFFNFLEAGLPVLMSSEMTYMAWLIKRYKIGVVFSKEDIPNLSTILERHSYFELQNNVLKIREQLSMENNFNRLLTFIENISHQR